MDPKKGKADTETDGRLEHELEAIQARYSALDAAEPPELVDQAVLNAARRAVTAKRPAPLRWIGAFATAAVLVLALTIVVQQQPESIETGQGNTIKLDSLNKKESAPGKSVFAPTEADRSATTEDELRDADVSLDQSVTGREDAPRPPSPQLQGAAMEEPQQEPLRARNESAASAEFSEDGAFKSTISVKPKSELREQEEQLRRQNAPMEEKLAGEVGKRVSDDRLPAAVTVPDSEEDTPGAASPGEWIKEMLMMLRAERFDQLEKELAAFRTEYPDYPLPAELENR